MPRWVIQRTRPTWIGLIGSKGRPEPVGQLAAHAQEQGIRVIGSRLVDDPDDPMQTLIADRDLLASLRHNGVRNVAVDLTGGRVPMSLGAFMAAEGARVDSIYVSVDDVNRQPLSNTARIRRVSGGAPGGRTAERASEPGAHRAYGADASSQL